MTPISADGRLLFGRTSFTRTGSHFAWKCSGDAHNQRGLTLFELLIALALISLMAVMASGGIRSASPHLAVRLASEQLLADIKRARLEADAANTAVTITIADAGYAISAIAIDRDLPRGVAIDVADGNEAGIIIGPGYWLKGYEIALSKGNAHATIIIEPITRRITLR